MSSGRSPLKFNEVKEFLKLTQGVTWHSCRVTLLAAAVQAQKPDKEIGLQANWKDPREPKPIGPEVRL